ncbi:MAG TPA: hypothetical protein VMN58_06620 [Acidimicrobiales bacterium]|nr:hypothetical protein [Acidimicrobiales bacterium]
MSTFLEVVSTVLLVGLSIAAIAYFGRFVLAEPLKKKRDPDEDRPTGDRDRADDRDRW